MIYYFTPTADDKNLGEAYNQYCSIVPNDSDWIALIDRDVLFLQPQYNDIIKQAIKDNPDAEFFTCITNRVGQREQCYNKKISEESDIIKHKLLSEYIYRNNKGKYTRLGICISGHFMLFQKKLWNEIKFKPGLLGVDNAFSQEVLNRKKRIILIEQLYVFHYYRLNEGIHNKSHLR